MSATTRRQAPPGPSPSTSDTAATPGPSPSTSDTSSTPAASQEPGGANLTDRPFPVKAISLPATSARRWEVLIRRTVPPTLPVQTWVLSIGFASQARKWDAPTCVQKVQDPKCVSLDAVPFDKGCLCKKETLAARPANIAGPAANARMKLESLPLCSGDTTKNRRHSLGSLRDQSQNERRVQSHSGVDARRRRGSR